MHGKIVFEDSSEVNSFLMSQINENKISYVHDGSESKDDSFSFVVSDGNHELFYVFPITSQATNRAQSVPIEIVSVDNKSPELKKLSVAHSLTSLDDGRTGFRLTSSYLKAEDRDSDSSTLKYVVTEYVQHGKIVNFAIDAHDSVESFTQGYYKLINCWSIIV